ncbi:linear amide C-N hydrolase [Stappia indica]|uniref:Linear amide C-N hydrolase n=1 Tax=Stappia indica TaxID=538381 RepID=A0A857C751_9HYPH|nr:linear amide C-N hydrolase [Stappia indica]QGZ34699.1 linear amide C-N hydrolase [Stappia indica]
MCTSLVYRDATGKAYFGRTLELTSDLPYQLAYCPVGQFFSSHLEGHATLDYESRHAFLAVTMPGRMPTREAPLGLSDFKVLEGLNDQGLTFSLLSYPAAGGPQQAVAATQAVLSASDLGSWALGRFASVGEVKAALQAQPVLLEALTLLGGVESPFHYVVHDAGGASLVIEFNKGAMSLYDNPVGVMTNGPEFPWHLTNLDNYTFLTNVDASSATFGSYRAVQPDSGIATAGLPSSSTSVGRFVRAAYYAQFTEKAATPDMAVLTLAHVMNAFDRPRGVSVAPADADGGHLEVAGLPGPGSKGPATEYTCWTNLSDLERRRFHLRTYRSLNYASFDLDDLASVGTPLILPLDRLDSLSGDATGLLKQAKPT